MKLSVHPYFLEFQRPFELAHGTRLGTQLAFVRLESEGIITFGEASLPPYLPETIDTVETWVMSKGSDLNDLKKENPLEHPELMPFSPENPAASSALQSALLYWYAKKKGVTLSELFTSSSNRPGLALTLTKADYPVLEEKLRLSQRFTHLKLKLTGSSDDMDFVKAISEQSQHPICVDVNQGFDTKEEAIKTIESLAFFNCVLVEQPLNHTDHEGHAWLKERQAIPIIADESIRNLNELAQYHQAFSGVNVKLMKCGGLFQAEQMIKFIDDSYPEGNFQKLLGCMSESSLGVATSAVIASQFEIADLDAPFLAKNNPFEGLTVEDGKIKLADEICLRAGFTID